MKRLTYSQIKKAMQNNNYILLRCCYNDGVIGINCKLLKTNVVMNQLKRVHGNKLSRYQSFRPCNFNDYITHKVPLS